MDRRQPAQRPNLHLPIRRCQSTTPANRCPADAPGRFRWLRSGPRPRRREPIRRRWSCTTEATEAASNSVTGPAKLVKCPCRPAGLPNPPVPTRSAETPARAAPTRRSRPPRYPHNEQRAGENPTRCFRPVSSVTPWGTAWCRSPTPGNRCPGPPHRAAARSCRTSPSSHRSDRAIPEWRPAPRPAGCA